MKVFKNVLIASLIGLVAAIPAHAQFGGLGGLVGGGKSSGGGDVGAQVAEFMTRSVLLSATAANALANINSAFDSEESLARRKKEQEELKNITDPQEKQARAAQIYESERAAAEKLAKSADLEDRVKKLDADKQKRFGTALFNFGIGMLQVPGLVKSGQGIMQSVSANPMNIPKVLPVKNALPLISKIAEDGGSTFVTFFKVAKGANISVPEAKAESKPVEQDL